MVLFSLALSATLSQAKDLYFKQATPMAIIWPFIIIWPKMMLTNLLLLYSFFFWRMILVQLTRALTYVAT